MNRATLLIAIALVCLSGGNIHADTYTTKMTTVDKIYFTMTTTKVVNNATDTFIFVPPAGSSLPTATVNCGAHRTVPYGPTAEGQASFTSGSGGGGGGGGNKEYGPSSRKAQGSEVWGIAGLFYMDQEGYHLDGDLNNPGVTLQFTNTVTGAFGVYTINIPFSGGFINFSGNDTTGYTLTSYNFHIGGFVAAGNNLPAPPQTLDARKVQP